jgi:GT2 family glycosyltransferase
VSAGRPDLSLVLVTHRSAAVVGGAVDTFRAEAARLGVSSEVVVVDHSEDREELDRLRAARPDTLFAEANRGYAAGVNAGLARASGDTILVGNPDVRFLAGSVAALLAALDAGWDIVGPQLVLAGLLFPTADLQTPGEELRRWLAGRAAPLWRANLRVELRRWNRAWDASATLALPTLSGALLAFRRGVTGRIGPWDDGYFLYFEETEWLRRASAIGLRVGLVPQARVEHLWGHTADPRRYAGHFMASRRRFLTAGFGWRGRLASRLRPGVAPLRPRMFPATAEELPGGGLLWLLSPTGLGFPAAGLHGEAPAFCRALRAVGLERGTPGRYLVMAVRPGRNALLGLWAAEA